MSALYAVDPGPLPPSYREMAEAIEHFAHEFYAVFSDDQAMPADLPLLQLAERLAAVRSACPTTHEKALSDGFRSPGDC